MNRFLLILMALASSVVACQKCECPTETGEEILRNMANVTQKTCSFSSVSETWKELCPSGSLATSHVAPGEIGINDSILGKAISDFLGFSHKNPKHVLVSVDSQHLPDPIRKQIEALTQQHPNNQAVLGSLERQGDDEPAKYWLLFVDEQDHTLFVWEFSSLGLSIKWKHDPRQPPAPMFHMLQKLTEQLAETNTPVRYLVNGESLKPQETLWLLSQIVKSASHPIKLTWTQSIAGHTANMVIDSELNSRLEEYRQESQEGQNPAHHNTQNADNENNQGIGNSPENLESTQDHLEIAQIPSISGNDQGRQNRIEESGSAAADSPRSINRQNSSQKSVLQDLEDAIDDGWGQGSSPKSVAQLRAARNNYREKIKAIDRKNSQLIVMSTASDIEYNKAIGTIRAQKKTLKAQQEKLKENDELIEFFRNLISEKNKIIIKNNLDKKQGGINIGNEFDSSSDESSNESGTASINTDKGFDSNTDEDDDEKSFDQFSTSSSVSSVSGDKKISYGKSVYSHKNKASRDRSVKSPSIRNCNFSDDENLSDSTFLNKCVDEIEHSSHEIKSLQAGEDARQNIKKNNVSWSVF